MISKSLSYIQISIQLNTLAKFRSSSSSKPTINQVKNLNLKFDTPEWTINLYPFYPQLFKKRGTDIYEIDCNSTVLGIAFLSKALEDYQTAWANRKTISLRFKELGLMMMAEPSSGRQVQIETARQRVNQNERLKEFKIKDISDKSQVQIILTSVIDHSRNQGLAKLRRKEQEWRIDTTMPYTQYCVMYKLLENSLLDLSGWNVMIQLQKRQYLSKLTNKLNEEREIDELFRDL